MRGLCQLGQKRDKASGVSAYSKLFPSALLHAVHVYSLCRWCPQPAVPLRTPAPGQLGVEAEREEGQGGGGVAEPDGGRHLSAARRAC